MIWLNKEQVMLLHTSLIEATGGISGVHDEGMIESSLTLPFFSVDGVSAFKSMQEKIARVAFGLVQNHPFNDGNKRIGAHVMLVLLALNKIKLSYTQEELSTVILDVASSKSDYDGLLNWIRKHSVN